VSIAASAGSSTFLPVRDSNSFSAFSRSESTFWKRCLMFSRTPLALEAYWPLRSKAALYSLICLLRASLLAEFFSMQVFLQPLSSSVPSQQSVQGGARGIQWG